MPQLIEPHFELELMVRDYECDLQGIVNNAVYQNYLEHTRHQFFHQIGFSFTALHQTGVDLVVTRIEMDLKRSLKSEDRFKVLLRCQSYGKVRFLFEQQVVHLPSQTLSVDAKVFGTALKNGKIYPPIKALPQLASFLSEDAKS